jgi:hypothetical protein
MIARARGALRSGQPDCQFATFAMVGPSGYAPMQWQSPGDVIVYRGDGLPITRDHVFLLWDYIYRMIDAFGDSEGPAPVLRRFSSRPYFQKFVQSSQTNGTCF